VADLTLLFTDVVGSTKRWASLPEVVAFLDA
jgi:class 3 adenylate cyclase